MFKHYKKRHKNQHPQNTISETNLIAYIFRAPSLEKTPGGPCPLPFRPDTISLKIEQLQIEIHLKKETRERERERERDEHVPHIALKHLHPTTE